MDQAEQEIRRLKASNKAWMLRCVHTMFSKPDTPYIEHEAMALLQRSEVKAYLSSVEADFGSRLEITRPSPRKVRISLAPHRLTPGKSSIIRPRTSDLPSSNLRKELGLESFEEADGEFDSYDEDEADAITTIDPEETERLVTRMIDMVSKEKEKLQATDDLDDNQDVALEIDAKVDEAIEEKEQILQKLMVTVKGYATLKSEYERLLETIGALEKERKELEAELEKAKSVTENSTAVENMKSRYKTIAAELETMKRERKKKEGAYIQMQRESKLCEALRKEILKLKESKVALQRQQKSQVNVLAKLKKEQQVQVLQMKKGDVRKQQQMNHLKTELSKKDRILHHRQREISRLTNKLQACEEHITQLLKIQNRNRNRQPAATATVPITPSNQFQLSASDLNHLESAKLILDNLVKDRIEMQHNKLQIDQKTTTKTQLSQKILAQSNILESLRERRLALEQKSNGSDDTDESQESLDLIDNEIADAEVSIDQIASEMDMIDTDLQELCRSYKVSNETGSAASSWEDICREVISSLSTGQTQQLLWDLLSEKSTMQEALLEVQDDNLAKGKALSITQQRVDALSKRLTQVTAECKDKLAVAELRYAKDTWELTKSNTNVEVLNQVAIRRAVELEEELRNKDESYRLLSLSIGSNQNFQQAIAAGSTQSEDSFFVDLQAVWNELGYNASQKDHAMTSFCQETLSLRQKLLSTQKEYLTTLRDEYRQLLDDVALFNLAMNKARPSTEVYERGGLVDGHRRLRDDLAITTDDFKEKVIQVSSMKERLLDYMMEMWLDSSSINPTLQKLLRFPSYDEDDDLASYARAIVKAASQDSHDQAMVLSAEQMIAWERAVRDLNMQRVNLCENIQVLRSKAINLTQILEVEINSAIVLSAIRNSYADADSYAHSLKSGSDDEEVATVLRILNQKAPPPGSSRIAEIIESMLAVLEDMSSGRRLLLSYLEDIVQSFHSQLEHPFERDLSNNLVPSNKNLSMWLDRTRGLHELITSTNKNIRQQLIDYLVELDKLCANTSTAGDANMKVSDFESKLSDVASSADMTAVADKYKAIHSMSLSSFDQELFSNTLDAIWSGWNSFLQPLLHQVILSPSTLSCGLRIDLSL
jgi:hypothetical protein